MGIEYGTKRISLHFLARSCINLWAVFSKRLVNLRRHLHCICPTLYARKHFLADIILPIRTISSACKAMFFLRNPGKPSYQMLANNCCTFGWATNYTNIYMLKQKLHIYQAIYNSKYSKRLYLFLS